MSSAQQPFWLGGASASMAACFTHPLDRTKYCMQVQSSRQPMLRELYIFATRDGIRSLWSGLSASILRQTTYSTARFGLYNLFSGKMKQLSGGSIGTSETIICAGVAGGAAGLLGNPTEVILVRMCADGVKLSAERYRYSNALSGMVRIGRDEGIRTFFKGLAPNILRSILMNVSQIAVYAGAKRRLLSNKVLPVSDGVPTHILASLAAGSVATTVCAPADVIKSRLQSASSQSGHGNGIVELMAKSLKEEGPGFLMKGWMPAWLRLAPNTVLMFIFMEQLQRIVGTKML